MIKNYVYILFSETLDQFYIGESIDIEERIKEHNSGFYKNAFTSKVNDWTLFLKIVCKERVQARKIETHIKSMKSKKYINDLKDYPKIIVRLKQRY
ncbi:MAG: GIY-YIG nuclease family protein [Bacteroidetes bacterium]|nr:MAG: GIY-YIG nuclease family protein [Bacteroidota bacterium]